MPNKKFEIPPLILPYFEELARIGVYGDKARSPTKPAKVPTAGGGQVREVGWDPPK